MNLPRNRITLIEVIAISGLLTFWILFFASINASGETSGDSVMETGDQTIGGTKTFTSTGTLEVQTRSSRLEAVNNERLTGHVASATSGLTNNLATTNYVNSATGGVYTTLFTLFTAADLLKLDKTVTNLTVSPAGVYTNARVYVDHLGRITNAASLAESGGVSGSGITNGITDLVWFNNSLTVTGDVTATGTVTGGSVRSGDGLTTMMPAGALLAGGVVTGNIYTAYGSGGNKTGVFDQTSHNVLFDSRTNVVQAGSVSGHVAMVTASGVWKWLPFSQAPIARPFVTLMRTNDTGALSSGSDNQCIFNVLATNGNTSAFFSWDANGQVTCLSNGLVRRSGMARPGAAASAYSDSYIWYGYTNTVRQARIAITRGDLSAQFTDIFPMLSNETTTVYVNPNNGAATLSGASTNTRVTYTWEGNLP